MATGEGIQSLKDLKGWQRRASVSIAADIAEGHGREGTKSFVDFLRIAQGSAKELETHLTITERVELAARERLEPLVAAIDETGRMLRSLIRTHEAELDA